MERDVGRHQSVYVCSTYMQLLLSSWGAYAYMHSPSHSNAIHVINKLKKKTQNKTIKPTVYCQQVTGRIDRTGEQLWALVEVGAAGSSGR